MTYHGEKTNINVRFFLIFVYYIQKFNTIKQNELFKFTQKNEEIQTKK